MNDSASSSIAKVTSPPSPAPAWARPACSPSSGATSSRNASASRRVSPRGSSRHGPGTSAGRSPSVTLELLLLAVADDLELDLVARLEPGDHSREVGSPRPLRRRRRRSRRRRPRPGAPGSAIWSRRPPRGRPRRRGCRGRPRRRARRVSTSMSSSLGELRVERAAWSRRCRRSRPRRPRAGARRERSARSIGTAKPTPSLPPEVVLICWLIPITLPSASSSGPPELPGLIEASVWIAPSIWNSVSDSIDRSVAETTPTESDCCSPNGLPIAATGSPTSTSCRAELERMQVEALGVDLEQGDVGERVEADDLGLDLVAVGELDVDLARLVDRAACAPACRRR